MATKRSAPSNFAAGPPGQRPRQGSFGAAREVAQPKPGQFVVKILLAAPEASAVLGQGGATCREISQTTGTKPHLSGRHEYYPGTSLQELSIRGATQDAVMNALFQALNKVCEDCSRICGSDPDVTEPGDCRVRILVPSLAARGVIGKGGENIKALRTTCNLHIHVQEAPVGQGQMSEQTVQMQGQLAAIQMGIPNIMEKTAELMEQPWFANWAALSYAGGGLEVAGKGKKGKGKGKGQEGEQVGHYSHDNGALASSGQMLATALATLPSSVADLSSKNHSVTMACPAGCVSGVIGKAGIGTKEIATLTGAKVMIRDIEGTETDKSVTLVGSAPGVAAAYLMVTARIAATLDYTPRIATAANGDGRAEEAS